MDGARIHAENSIRQKNQSLSYLRLSARASVVAQKVEELIATKKISTSIMGITKIMDIAMKNMSLETITNVMDSFEKHFEELEVHTATVERTVNSSTTGLTPEDQVDTLMKQVADEAGLDMKLELPSIINSSVESIGSKQKESARLEDRLARLREK